MENKWRVALNYGLIGGMVMLYFSAIGMVLVFSERQLIGSVLNLGHLLLFGGGFLAGYMLHGKTQDESFGTSMLLAAFTGLIASIPVVILMFAAKNFNLRDVFVNISPNMADFLAFGQELVPGALILVLVTIIVSVVAAALHRLPDEWTVPVSNGMIWTLVIAIMSEHIDQILRNLLGRAVTNLVFDGDALRIISTVIIFALITGLSFWLTRRKNEQEGMEIVEATPEVVRRKQIIQFILIGIALIIAPWIVGRFLSQVLWWVGLFIMMGLGLNIVVGYAGLLDLGYVAFFAFGAYTMGILTTATNLNASGGTFNFWMALPVVVLVSVVAGLILGFPVLRMRGDYLAIVTLGFGEIIRLLALSDWLAPFGGGAQGVLKIPNPVFFGYEMNTPEVLYYLVVVGMMLAAFISIRLRDSRLGRQWMAMREDEDVAEAMGINLVATKLMAFAIGAGFSGLAGAIYAVRLSNIFPHSFNLIISMNVLSLIIVGGMGSIPGVVVGALVLVGLPELLREFAEYRLLMYGLLLIVMMLIRPEGFIPAEVIKREFHKDEQALAEGD